MCLCVLYAIKYGNSCRYVWYMSIRILVLTLVGPFLLRHLYSMSYANFCEYMLVTFSVFVEGMKVCNIFQTLLNFVVQSVYNFFNTMPSCSFLQLCRMRRKLYQFLFCSLSFLLSTIQYSLFLLYCNLFHSNFFMKSCS